MDNPLSPSHTLLIQILGRDHKGLLYDVMSEDSKELQCPDLLWPIPFEPGWKM
ncbi:unnamed protein product [Musa acuminata subsp. malaccensis]|uniref:(wild Malaysian banana) hypothetical protein n=1 Tax=Musa acuminata subsp. malaccensis TaxID=214687 RepID=A0A804KKW2_MUSAM|nr:unnamed protein product [Musa acuminata subsp. malaccensis]